MSDLFFSLTSAARALEAQRYGLDVTGQNIANVNTPGYTRRVITMAAVPPYGPHSAGGGVDVTGVRAVRDLFLERRLQQEMPSEQREAAMANALSIVEVALGKPGESLDAAMNAFFDSFANLAETPSSSVARHEVLVQGEAVADAFHDMADRLALSRRDVDGQVRGTVEDINRLTAQIADLNDALGKTLPTDLTFPHLQDEQSQLVRQLSQLIDLDVTQREDGGVDVTIGNGRALVIGQHDYALTMTQANGVTSVFAGTTDIGAEISAGSLGGLLYTRDVLLPAYQSDLDTLANEFVQQVNTVHAAGVGGDGGTGRDFFSFSSAITPPAGAAGALVVDAAVAANEQLVAAAGAGAPVGDNATARTLAALRNARVVGGTATLVDTWGELVYRVGRDSQAAASERQSRREIVKQVAALRDQVSGISLDEEAMQMLKFQRAYEANARFFTTVDETLDMLMSLAR